MKEYPQLYIDFGTWKNSDLSSCTQALGLGKIPSLPSQCRFQDLEISRAFSLYSSSGTWKNSECFPHITSETWKNCESTSKFIRLVYSLDCSSFIMSMYRLLLYIGFKTWKNSKPSLPMQILELGNIPCFHSLFKLWNLETFRAFPPCIGSGTLENSRAFSLYSL